MSTPNLSVLEVAALLEATLGREKSGEVVRAAMVALGIGGTHLDQPHVAAILEYLSRTQGIVGLAARYAQQRSRFTAPTLPPPPLAEDLRDDASHATQPRASATAQAAQSAGAPSRGARAGSYDHSTITDLFAATLGEAKSDEVVRAAIRHLGFQEDALDHDQVLAVLEGLARVPGVVGMTARFAKARFILRFA